MILRTRLAQSISLLAAAAVLPAMVVAEDTEDTSFALEEVVVTATKRAQSVQDVSLSVTAVSASELVASGITDISRLDTLAPGLKFGQSGNDARPSMRGARTEQVESADVAIAFYTDGLYRPRHGQAMAGFVDVDRVEVLRGPQGTLFGRNAFGGAINVISAKPSLDETDYGFAATVGNYGQRRGEGFFNLPLSENAALRIAGVREVRDPYVENTFNSSAGLKDADTSYLRGQLLFAPSEDLDITLRAELWDDGANGTGSFGYAVLGSPVNPETGLTNGVSGTLTSAVGRLSSCATTCGRQGAGLDANAAQVTGDPYKVSFNTKPKRDVSETTLAAEINWRGLDFADLKVIVANMDYEELRFEDGDFSPYHSIEEGNDITSDTSSIEVQFTSNHDGPVEWVAGLYYLKEDLTDAFLWKDINGVFNGNLVDNAPDPNTPADPNWAPWMNEINLETESLAFYGQASWSLTDTLRLIGGIRYTEDEREWDIYSQDDNDLSRINFSELVLAGASEEWDAVTWRAGIEVDLSENSMFYANASTGFLAGNAQGAFNGASTYDEQNVTAYEIGVKSMLLGGRVRLNVAAYYNQYEDLLATGFVDAGGTTLAFFGNAGDADAMGLEIEADWAVTEQLQLGIRAAFSNAEYGDFVTTNAFEEGGETINGIDNLFDLDGDQVAMSPDVTLTLLGSYDIDLGDMGMLTPAITLVYSDDYRAQDWPYFYGEQDSYTQTDLTLNWQSADDSWHAQLFVRNLEDEAVLMRGTRFGGNVAVVDYGAPQTYGLRIGYQY